MVQLVKKPQVKVIAKDGEITISLDLNVNLNINGNPVDVEEKVTKQDEHFIPDFGFEKIKFGEKV